MVLPAGTTDKLPHPTPNRAGGRAQLPRAARSGAFSAPWRPCTLDRAGAASTGPARDHDATGNERTSARTR